MGDTPSRGRALSSYLPNVDGPSGVAVHFGEMRGQYITGQILCANVVYAKTHQLGEAPSLVVLTPMHTLAQANSASVINVSEVGSISAETSAAYYVAGNTAGAKFKAFILV